MERHSFPGSIAVVKDPAVKVPSEGVTTSMYFRGAEADRVQQYGTEVGKLVSYFTGTFGLAPYANLTVVETEAGAPNGYAAPGMMFLSPPAITRNVNSNLLANEVSRQWWEEDISPATRNHLWLTNGFAAYSELLWAEHNNGAAYMATQLHDVMVTALTVDNVPVIQSSRLEDYSPELWALTAHKGAAVLNMLRYTIGDDKFQQVLKQYVEKYAFKSVVTDDLRKVVDEVTGKSMDYFFIQWIESSGAPEFRLEYTDLPHHQRGRRRRLPRDGQNLAGSRHLPHARGPADRNRRQSRDTADRSGGHLLGVLRGHLRQAQEYRDRSG